MNEKTQQLREIFTDVTDGEATITESQEDTRGSLAGDGSEDDRLEAVIEQMNDRYGFETPLSVADLVSLAKGFYDGDSDAEIADEIGTDPETVFDGRLSLHLLREEDADGVDLAAIRNRADDDATLAEEYGVSEADIERYRTVADAEDESRTANDRYRDEFDSILAESELSTRMATNVREDGLEDATEGMETDVSF